MACVTHEVLHLPLCLGKSGFYKLEYDGNTFHFYLWILRIVLLNQIKELYLMISKLFTIETNF